jgi:hypothetical protein
VEVHIGVLITLEEQFSIHLILAAVVFINKKKDEGNMRLLTGPRLLRI